MKQALTIFPMRAPQAADAVDRFGPMDLHVEELHATIQSLTSSKVRLSFVACTLAANGENV